MSSSVRFATTVIYVDDLVAAIEFYRQAAGLEPQFYDEAAGFAELGAEKRLALAAHRAGDLMMPGAYNQHGQRVSAVELAFYADDVPAAYHRAVAAGASPLTPPREMPWGQTVAYAQSPEGTILGFVTQMPEADGA
ncbi:VOC family protein [Longimicrobium sp.]|uniref:VOC family protein n=1 Tax=Longimicrobium sp. TaxID=2029185 RepID=UPI003B3BC7DA